MRERASIHSRRSTSSFSSGGGFPGSHAINAATQPEEQKRHSRLHRQHADLLVERTRTFVHQVGDWSRVRVRKNMMAFLSEYLVGPNDLASCVCAQRREGSAGSSDLASFVCAFDHKNKMAFLSENLVMT